MDIQLDQNYANCIIEKTDLLVTRAVNICTGEVVIVPHGTVDFIGGTFLAIILVAMFTLLGGIFYKLLTDF
jgi:hypothetical protein